jgi:hypothetical protein
MSAAGQKRKQDNVEAINPIKTNIQDRNKGTWKMQYRHTVGIRIPKRVYKEALGYRSESEANGELGLFSYARDKDNAQNWMNLPSRRTEDQKQDNAKYLTFKESYEDPYYVEITETSTEQLTRNHEEATRKEAARRLAARKLNAVEKAQFRRIKKMQSVSGVGRGEVMKMDEFKANFIDTGACGERSKQDSTRKLRSIIRQFDKVMTDPDDANKIKYLENRQRSCEDDIVINKDVFEYLRRHISEDETFKLIVRNGEKEPRKDARKEDFSTNQVQKIKDQAFIVSCLFRRMSEKNRYEKEKIANTLDAVSRAENSKEKTDLLTRHYQWKEETFKPENSMDVLYKEVNGNLGIYLQKEIATRTVEDWYRDFVTHERKGFSEDKRGKKDSSRQ